MKEIKVPHPYKVHYKVRVPYIVKQEIHTVPIHSHPIHSSEHIHHGSSGSGYSSGGGSGYDSSSGFGPSSGSSFGGQSFTSHGASSNVAPMFVSHSPIAMTSQAMFSQQSAPRSVQAAPKIASSPQQNQISSAPKGAQQSASQQSQISSAPKFAQPAMSQNVFQSSSPLYMTGLNTMIQASAGGFKQGGAPSSGGYEVREASSDTGPAMFNTQEAAKAGSTKSFVAYPYPFKHQNEKNPFEYSFGFSPSDPLYGF